MLRLLTLALLVAAVSTYTIKTNPDAGDFTIFPLVSLGAQAFPTTMAFSSDGRIFVGRKNGIINIIDANGNLESEPWIDLTATVNCAGDKGLTSLKLHPNFPTVPYVYLTYPLWQDYNHDLNVVTQGVVARYTEINGKGSVASEFLLVGKVMKIELSCPPYASSDSYADKWNWNPLMPQQSRDWRSRLRQ